MVDTVMLLALANLVIGAGIVGASICRINAMRPEAPFMRAVPFALLSCAGLVIALGPLNGNWPSADQVFIALCVLVYLLLPGGRRKREH